MAKGWPAATRTVLRKGYWREGDARVVVEAWRASGRSIEEFAAAHELDARRISRWARRLGQSRSTAAEPPVKRAAMRLQFHPVELVGGDRPTRDAGIEIILADASRVRVPVGFAAEDLARVLHVLSGRSRC